MKAWAFGLTALLVLSIPADGFSGGADFGAERVVAPLGGPGLSAPVGTAEASTIDLLVLYTPATRRAAGGGEAIRSRIREAIDFTNATFADSRISVRVRAVGIRETAYEASRATIVEDFLFLAQDRSTAELREELRADLVALVKPTTRPTISGAAVGMSRRQFGTAIAPAPFFVASLDVMPMNFTHELGHIFGCDHDPTDPDAQRPEEAVFPYAFAHFEPGLFRTIMVEEPDTCPGCPKIPRFSNPNVFYQGRPTGVAGARDNARTVEETAPIVATFDSLPGRVGLQVDRIEVDEAAGQATIDVLRTHGAIGRVTVDYGTVDGSARAGEDFVPVAGTLTWETGQADVPTLPVGGDLHRRRITVPILADGAFEGPETFTLALAEPDGGAERGLGRVEITIRDDDEAPTDFAFDVSIHGRDGAEIPSRIAPTCIPDTVCVSGAVPGRSEVFLRVAGPKPNGFFWPTLAKFSTSEVRVQVRRLATGEAREYVLAGAVPGSDLLPGLFDRRGFAADGAQTAADRLGRARSRAGGAHQASAVASVIGRMAPPTPPSDAWMTAPALPGYRFQVRVTSQSGVTPETRVEPVCVAETACVSAALPGRSELFLRIVGPKPNGFLWPTLVRLSTSRLEVWIEQEASGALRYYRLDGASPGEDSLNGLFDRTGFDPAGSSGAVGDSW